MGQKESMSANNYLYICRDGTKYLTEECDADTNGAYSTPFSPTDTLEDAVRAANEYMKENEVEYGLRIDI